MKKVLFIATYGDFLATFEYSNIKIWQELGVEVHCASNFSNKEYNRKIDKLEEINVIKHEISFLRKPFAKSNFKEFNKLKKVILDEKIDIIDTHNAVASAFARIAAHKCKVKKVIYTPHSFFFYKGCSLKNKLIYKNIELFLSKYTDLLITINSEDFAAAKKFPTRGKVLYVPGVGINTKVMFNIKPQKEKYCKEFNIPLDSKIYISVGELINRKNHITAIRAFAKANISNAYYLICGIGELKDELLEEIIKLKMEDKILLLGYRVDAKEIIKSSDVFIFPSFQEGLPVALMEAMACGLPCFASRIRGNIDLIEDGVNGILFDANNYIELSNIISSFKINNDIKQKYMKNNQEKILQCDIKNVKEIMKEEYKKLLWGENG